MQARQQNTLYRKHLPLDQDESFSAPTIKKSSKPGKILIYFSSHLQAIVASCGRLVRTPFASLMTLIVISIALAIPSTLFVLLQNVKQLSNNWHNGSQISLYLKADTTPEQTQTLLTQLSQQKNIATAKYISPQQGLAELQQQSDLQAAIAELNQNPLPGVILIEPAGDLKAAADVDQLLQQLKNLPQVDIAQLDMQWIKRFYAILTLVKQGVYALGCLLGLGVLFIIGSTINAAMQRYRREIEVFKLVGATNAFVRRPFLYTGMLLGLLGSLLAWLLVGIFVHSLQTPVHTLASLYNSQFQLQDLNLATGSKLILIGLILGLMGAWLAVGKHLRNY